jgi:hypothetical protein
MASAVGSEVLVEGICQILTCAFVCSSARACHLQDNSPGSTLPGHSRVRLANILGHSNNLLMRDLCLQAGLNNILL